MKFDFPLKNLLRPLFLGLLFVLSACATPPPKDMDNACSILDENRDWYWAGADARKKWGTPISVSLAIVHQESRFVHDAKPDRRKLLGFIPWKRLSSSYGYAQAVEGAWEDYQKDTGNSGADRDDFEDTMDFIGWYNFQTWKKTGVSRNDAYNLYLAYHEGHGGFARGSYKKGEKAWLRKTAQKVSNRAQMYRSQLLRCEEKLKKRGFFGWLFS